MEDGITIIYQSECAGRTTLNIKPWKTSTIKKLLLSGIAL